MTIKGVLKYSFIAIISLTLLITAFGFVYLIFDYVLNLSESNFSGVVAFLGSIIGGALTFIGVLITIKRNFELNKENLKYQENIQKSSINKSAELNNKKERELIVANIQFSKLDLIVQHLIENNLLNTERFNVLRRYIDCCERINVVHKKRGGSFGESSYEEEIKPLFEELNILLEEETELRIKIMHLSAKIKSDSMYIDGMDDKLDSFRVFQTDTLEEFSDLIRQRKYDFGKLIEIRGDKIMKMSNESIRLCKRKIQEEMLDFQNT